MSVLALVALSIISASTAPSVVFLSVDTLRTDFIGAYGAPWPTTPNLDAFAKQSLVFENAVCEEGQTTPSFVSMMTSRYPRMTGVVRNASPLPKHIPTVAERFKEAGYRTICIQNNWNLKRELCGLDRGFDVYDDTYEATYLNSGAYSRPADKVTDLAITALEALSGEAPCFFWFHYMDPHSSYQWHEGFTPRGPQGKAPNEFMEAHAAYASEVAFTDHHIGRLLEHIPKDNVYVFFVADHGESIYEHRYRGHTERLFQNIVHIPLMIRGPGIKPGRSAAPVRGVDVGPTLLGLVNIPPSVGMMGLDLLKDTIDPARIRIMETYPGILPGTKRQPMGTVSDSPSLQALISGKWKYILNPASGLERLYDIKSDPRERKNLAKRDDMKERMSALAAHIAEWNERIPVQWTDQAPLSEEDIDALKAEGYL